MAARRLTAIDIGRGLFVEEQGMQVLPAMLVWHQKRKAARRIGDVDAWARRHACDVGVGALQLDCQHYVACGGARWRRCTARFPGRRGPCPSKLVDLQKEARPGPGAAARLYL